MRIRMYVLQSFLTVTIRMEYAPDGKFINQHSFLAVERNYPAVKFKLRKVHGLSFLPLK